MTTNNDSDAREQDPGFGTKVLPSQGRLVRSDGSFHVRRKGGGWIHRVSGYRWLVEMGWGSFFAVAVGGYVAINSLFAWAFLLLGPESLAGTKSDTIWGRYGESWFFSAQTLTTVGYGHIAPHSVAASALAAFEALVGLMAFGLWTGLLFARFSRAKSHLVFSQVCVVTRHKEGLAWMFRLASAQDQVLLEAEASVMYSWVEHRGSEAVRHYRDLVLERSSVRALPLNWTLVHRIDESSPLFGKDRAELEAADAEILAFVRVHDDAFGQQVHARASWKAQEIRFGERFVPILAADPDGTTVLDLTRLQETVREASA